MKAVIFPLAITSAKKEESQETDKTVKRKTKKTRSVHRSAEPKLELEAAAPWPVFECMISAWWRDPESLTHILVAKEPPFGGVVCCVFLVDLGCLGPKQAFVTQFRTRSEYETELRAMMMDQHPMVFTEYPLVAKIISQSLRYASQLGFESPPRVERVLAALGSLDVADQCEEEVPLGGTNGKPFYMAGPDDDVDHVMTTLIRTCGHGNFVFTIPEGPIPRDFFA